MILQDKDAQKGRQGKEDNHAEDPIPLFFFRPPKSGSGHCERAELRYRGAGEPKATRCKFGRHAPDLKGDPQDRQNAQTDQEYLSD